MPVDIFHKSLQLQGYTYIGKLHYPDTEDYDDLFLSADGKTEAKVYANLYSGWIIEYIAHNPEDLNHIIPADQAPASRKARRIAPDLRRSSTRSTTMRDGYIKPMRLLKAHGRSLQ